jgi:hygromycin-B 7''-O-kinase
MGRADVVVKTQRPHRLRPRTSLEKEARILRELTDKLGDRIPRPYGYGRLDAAEGEVVEYLVMSRMPGDPLVRHPVPAAARAALMREVGALLAALHRVPTDPLLADPAVFPLDRDGKDLVRRLEAGFADLADLIAETLNAGRWRRPWRTSPPRRWRWCP